MHTQVSKFGVRTVTETYIKSPFCLVFSININIIMEIQKLVSPHYFCLFPPINCFFKIKIIIIIWKYKSWFPPIISVSFLLDIVFFKIKKKWSTKQPL